MTASPTTVCSTCFCWTCAFHVLMYICFAFLALSVTAEAAAEGHWVTFSLSLNCYVWWCFLGYWLFREEQQRRRRARGEA